MESKLYRVLFDNEAEVTVHAKNERQAFYIAKRSLIKCYKAQSDREWLDSMSKQYPNNAKVIRL